MKIIIYTDIDGMPELVGMILRGGGHEIFAFSKYTHDTHFTLTKEKPDLAIFQYGIFGSDDLSDLINFLKIATPQTRICVMSGDMDDKKKDMMIRAGADDTICSLEFLEYLKERCLRAS